MQSFSQEAQRPIDGRLRGFAVCHVGAGTEAGLRRRLQVVHEAEDRAPWEEGTSQASTALRAPVTTTR
jgi:hypothetical protein